jgi:predicted DNA-binding transcriptional regulator AlpA
MTHVFNGLRGTEGVAPSATYHHFPLAEEAPHNSGARRHAPHTSAPRTNRGRRFLGNVKQRGESEVAMDRKQDHQQVTLAAERAVKPKRRDIRKRLQDNLNYPPRAMRAERAAAYLDISGSTFFRLVDEGELPQPVKKKGVVSWDRMELDAAYENWKEGGDAGSSTNTMLDLLGKVR